MSNRDLIDEPGILTVASGRPKAIVMDEASKTNAIRKPDFFTKYLGGRVIDIGAGPDLVCEWAERFDIEDGDANVNNSIPSGRYI